MLGGEFFKYFTENFGHYPDDRTVLSPQSLHEDAVRPGMSPGNQDTIVILYTGGTIGAKQTADGYAPTVIDTLEDFAALHPELAAQLLVLKTRYPNTKFAFESIPPLDSGAMTDANRFNVIEAISNLSQKYGTKMLSLIALHGTDSAVETACLLDNFVGDGGVPLFVVSSQYAPGRLGGDGAANFLHAVSMSHCNISGTYLVAAGKIYHPADCRKKSDSGVHIFGTEDYGFGEAGEVFDGGVKMRVPFTARGYDALSLPYAPKEVIELGRNMDTKGRFVYIANSLTTHDIQAKADSLNELHHDLVFIEARGASSVTESALKAATDAASVGIPAIVASTVPQSSGDIHYAIAADLNKPGILRAPGIASILHRRYAALSAIAYSKYLVNRIDIAQMSRTTDPLRPYLSKENTSGPYIGNEVSALYAIFAGVFTRGQRKGIDYAKAPALHQAGFQRLIRSL